MARVMAHVVVAPSQTAQRLPDHGFAVAKAQAQIARTNSRLDVLDRAVAVVRTSRRLFAPALDAGGNALTAAPRDSAPRLYVETLNEMIDQQTVRIAALNNRIPNAALALEVFGAAFAFGLLRCTRPCTAGASPASFSPAAS
jgi:hypothetical protein